MAATRIPNIKEILTWLDEFLDHVMRNLGFAYLSIIKEWEQTCRLNPNRRVFIWTLHRVLAGYDRRPGQPT